MKKLTLTEMFINLVKKIFLPTHGKLLLHEISFPREVYEYHDEVLSDLEMKKQSEDKINMRNDGLKLKKDAKSAFADYHQKCVHG